MCVPIRPGLCSTTSSGSPATLNTLVCIASTSLTQVGHALPKLQPSSMLSSSNRTVFCHCETLAFWFVYQSPAARYWSQGCNEPRFICRLRHYIKCLLAYLSSPLTFFLAYALSFLSTSLRIGPLLILLQQQRPFNGL